ncbi:MAG: Ig-like domain-containing protein [Planctomycetota bacterium]
MKIFQQSKSSQRALKNYRQNQETERRKALLHNLRLESLEQRVVFAGVSPVAVNDTYEALVDEPLQVETSGVLANDLDIDGDSLTALEFLGPRHGELELRPDGTFSYQPNPGFVGQDGFLYQVDDGSSASNFAAVTIQVTDPNVAPEGANDFYSMPEDEALNILVEEGVLANDFDANQDELTVELMDLTEHGTVELQPDGSFSYTPDPDFYGTDAFTYRISDGAKQSDLVVVELSIEPVADAPIAVGESLAAMEDEALSIASVDLLANDTDVDSESLEITLEQMPEHGTLTVQDDGGFVYAPVADFHGTDSFTYRVSDGELMSEIVMAEIVVASVNDAPVAEDDTMETDEATAITFAPDSLLMNDMDLDGDTLVAEIAEAPQNGTLEEDTDGNWTYTPDEGFVGMDSFSYHAMDGSDSAAASVSILVHEVVQLPVANNEAYQATAGETLSVASEDGVLANDIEDLSNPAPLEAEIYRGPQHGELEMQSDGSFEYTPSSDFAGIDSVIYRTHEGENSSHLAVATLYVSTPEVEITPDVIDDSLEASPPSEDPGVNPDPTQPEESDAPVTEPEEVASESPAEGESPIEVEEVPDESPQRPQRGPWANFFRELDDFWFEITCFFR